MQNPKHKSDTQKQKRSQDDWEGLGNRPRNENLAKIRGPASFEKRENDSKNESNMSSHKRLGKKEKKAREMNKAV